MMHYQLIIPMSGKGSRFRQAGYSELKPFIEVAGKPMIEHILEMYPNRTKTIFVVNSSDPELDEHNRILKDLSPEALIVELPDNRLGPSYAVLNAKIEIDPDLPIVVNYADFAGVWSEKEFINELVENDACILTYTKFHPHMLRNSSYAYVKKEGNLVTHIQEKQSFTESPMEEEASAGAYAFKSGALLLEAIDTQMKKDLSLFGEFYTSLTMQPLLDWGKKISTTLMEKFYQWGTPTDLEDWKSWRNFLDNLSNEGINLQGENPHEVAILAGGRGNRLYSSVTTPKALFSVQGRQLWEYSIIKGSGVSNKLFLREEYCKDANKNKDAIIFPLKFETKGQAETALIALEATTSPGGISFLACDNIVLGLRLEFSQKDGDEDVLYLWVVDSYQNAKSQPEQFSWVEVLENGEIGSYYPKQKPPVENCKTVIGNFTFSNKSFARDALTYCNSPGNFINKEPYLDSAINFALKFGKRIVAIEVGNFKAIGTSIELQTFEYWNDCKTRKLLAWN